MENTKPTAKKLKKEDVVPGTIVEIRSDKALSNGLTWFDKGSGLNTNFDHKNQQTMEVRFPSTPTHKFDIWEKYQIVSYAPGSKFEVIVEPKKRAESHTVVVKDLMTGREGFVHWTEFSACCILSPTIDLSLENGNVTKPNKPKM